MSKMNRPIWKGLRRNIRLGRKGFAYKVKLNRDKPSQRFRGGIARMITKPQVEQIIQGMERRLIIL